VRGKVVFEVSSFVCIPVSKPTSSLIKISFIVPGNHFSEKTHKIRFSGSSNELMREFE